jgi:hypothetical protein
VSYQIIKQPDGKLAIFSSVVDQIIVWDATAEEIVDWFARDAAEQAAERTRWDLERLEQRGPGWVYRQFALSWERAVEKDREHGGEASGYFGITGGAS